MEITVTPSTIKGLRTFQDKPKFVKEGFYSGALNETVQKRCEESINILVEKIIKNIEQNPQKEFVIDEFENTLANFDEEDTEEREQACVYLEQLMAILGVENSNGVLNKWLYGFDPNSINN